MRHLKSSRATARYTSPKEAKAATTKESYPIVVWAMLGLSVGAHFYGATVHTALKNVSMTQQLPRMEYLGTATSDSDPSSDDPIDPMGTDHPTMPAHSLDLG